MNTEPNRKGSSDRALLENLQIHVVHGGDISQTSPDVSNIPSDKKSTINREVV